MTLSITITLTRHTSKHLTQEIMIASIHYQTASRQHRNIFRIQIYAFYIYGFGYWQPSPKIVHTKQTTPECSEYLQFLSGAKCRQENKTRVWNQCDPIFLWVSYHFGLFIKSLLATGKGVGVLYLRRFNKSGPLSRGSLPLQSTKETNGWVGQEKRREEATWPSASSSPSPPSPSSTWMVDIIFMKIYERMQDCRRAWRGAGVDSLVAKVLVFLTRLFRQLSDHQLYSCGRNFGQISPEKLHSDSLHTSG